MDKGLDIEDFDAFFNMRCKFWEESRDRALAEKARNQGRELGHKIVREKTHVVYPYPARSVSAG